MHGPDFGSEEALVPDIRESPFGRSRASRLARRQEPPGASIWSFCFVGLRGPALRLSSDGSPDRTDAGEEEEDAPRDPVLVPADRDRICLDIEVPSRAVDNHTVALFAGMPPVTDADSQKVADLVHGGFLADRTVCKALPMNVKPLGGAPVTG